MTKYLPEELKDLQASKERVMKHVKLNIKQQKRSNVLKISSIVIASAATLTLLILSVPYISDYFNPPAVTSDDPIIEEKPVDELVEDFSDVLRQYVTPDQQTKHFIDSDGHRLTVETVWLSDFYFKEKITFDEIVSYNYYRIDENNYEQIVEASSNGAMTLDELQSITDSTVLIHAPFDEPYENSEWTIFGTEELYGVYKNALIIERVEGNKITQQIFIPTMGFIGTIEYTNGVDTYVLALADRDTQVPTGDLMFTKYNQTAIKPSFNTAWLPSPSTKQRITLEGRGQTGSEEGIATILLENVDGKQTMYELANNDEQLTPKQLIWIDEQRLFVMIGYAYGTVTLGGEIYILDLNTGALSPIIANLDENTEVQRFVAQQDGYYEVVMGTYVDEQKTEVQQYGYNVSIVKGIVQAKAQNELTIQPNAGGEAIRYAVYLNKNYNDNALIKDEAQVGQQVEAIIFGNEIIQLNRITP